MLRGGGILATTKTSLMTRYWDFLPGQYLLFCLTVVFNVRGKYTGVPVCRFPGIQSVDYLELNIHDVELEHTENIE